MEGVFFLFGLAFIWLVFATFSDIRTRDIYNWVNFSLIIFALGFRFFYSLFELGNFWLLYQGILGIVFFFILSTLLYYARMYAGGDLKLMISLGAILPIFPSFFENLKIFILFFLLFLLFGAVYGIVRSVLIAILNFRRFGKGFRKLLSEKKNLVLVGLFSGVILLLMGFWIDIFVYLGLFVFFFLYFFLFLKAVDDYCMVKRIRTSELTPGDWLYEDVQIGKKKVETNWEGLSSSEIKMLRKKKFVLVRRGIVFAPVFLGAFILLWILLEFGLLTFVLNLF